MLRLPSTRIRFVSVFGLLLACLPCAAVAPYTPRPVDPFAEQWRWTELEALTEHDVRGVDEASDGTLWFSHPEGLVSYDGSKTLFHPTAAADLPGAFPRCIKVGPDDTVYLLTAQYLVSYRAGVWRVLQEHPSERLQIDAIAEGPDGSMWVGYSAGLFRISPAGIEPVTTEFSAIGGVLVDQAQCLWVADAHSGDIVIRNFDDTGAVDAAAPPVRRIKNSADSPGYPQITRLNRGHEDRVWILNQNSPDVVRVFADDQVRAELTKSIHTLAAVSTAMVEDDAGDLWLLSVDGHLLRLRAGELDRYYLDEHAFSTASLFLKEISGGRIIAGGRLSKTLLFDQSSKRWASYHGLNFHCESPDGGRWFLSAVGRVVRQDTQTGEWNSYGPEDGIIAVPNAMICDRRGRVWVSGRASPGTPAVSWFDDSQWTTQRFPRLGTFFSHLGVIETEAGELLFGIGTDQTQLRNASGGYVRFSATADHPSPVIVPPPHAPPRIASMTSSQNGTLWFGAIGLFERAPHANYQRNARFDHNWIDRVASDSQDNIWVAVWGSGVHHFDGETWSLYNESNGLASNQVIDLLPQGDIVWAGTSKGISRFDGTRWTTLALPRSIRISREGGTLKAGADGSLWINVAPRSWNFRGQNPADSADRQFFTVHHEPETAPPETQILTAPHRLLEGSVAHFSWSGHDTWSQTRSSELEYAYRIDDQLWSPFQSGTDALLDDLGAGSHRLEVRARDLSGNLDPSPAMIAFHVVPPLWKRAWFITLLVLTAGLIAVLVTVLIRMRIRHILAMEEFKIQFFTNISHELRTPLSVIIGPLESLLKRHQDPDQKALLEMAHRNTAKMLRLITDLLDFRRAESGKQKYRPVRGDLILFLREALYAHTPLWEQKKQGFHLTAEREKCEACFDPDKLQRIVDNLVSNAVKYTPEGGNLTARIAFFIPENQTSIDWLRLTIEDDGIGIPAESLATIFEPYQRAVGKSRQVAGSGIGLAYSRELAHIWGGEIEVQSPLHPDGRGSRFMVELPLLGDAATQTLAAPPTPTLPTAPAEATDPAPAPENDQVDLDDELENDEADTPSTRPASSPRLLLVEDNSDVRTFLTHELGDEFAISTAVNGVEGWDMAREAGPDLIISDVMMPEMDGVELCRRLKANAETSHIPLIILTAKRANEDAITGVQAGADDYLSKPVKLELLRAKIRTLLEARRVLRERFARKLVLEPGDITITDKDADFLQSAITIVEEHMRDEEFSVDDFARAMRMSRVNFQRKLKALSGLTPVQFLRKIRLKRAAQLLRSGQFYVSEVLEQIGILDQSYFGKLFKREYGMSPSQCIPDKEKSPPSDSA